MRFGGGAGHAVVDWYVPYEQQLEALVGDAAGDQGDGRGTA